MKAVVFQMIGRKHEGNRNTHEVNIKMDLRKE